MSYILKLYRLRYRQSQQREAVVQGRNLTPVPASVYFLKTINKLN
jgi:hypothetical protein